MTTGKTIALTTRTFVGKVMSLLFSMLSWLVIAFLPRSKKRLLISWLQSSSAVILEPKKIKSLTVSIVSHLFAMKWWDRMPWSLIFESWVLSQLFHSPLSPSSRGSFSPIYTLFFISTTIYYVLIVMLRAYEHIAVTTFLTLHKNNELHCTLTCSPVELHITPWSALMLPAILWHVPCLLLIVQSFLRTV